MAKRVIRVIITVLGFLIGLSLADVLFNSSTFASIFTEPHAWLAVIFYTIFSVIFGLLGFIITPWLIKLYKAITKAIMKRFADMPIGEIFIGAIGLIIGLVIAWLISTLTRRINPPVIGTVCSIALFLVCGYIGWTVPSKKIKEINLPKWLRHNEYSSSRINAVPKVLDTSAIIDGRFFDVYKTGIIEGIIMIPEFILGELRHISDSADPIKRSRGRKGLEMLQKMQDSQSIAVYDKDYPDITEVDVKLIRFVSEHRAMLVTTDYNLNKICTVQNVPVFNVNDLSNALKINVTAGEILLVTIVKEGKEMNQGVAYFDDGTMIVIDGARKLIGQQVSVVVTSVLQTSAGRMVFAKLNE